jgi:Na+/phosphate symporter
MIKIPPSGVTPPAVPPVPPKKEGKTEAARPAQTASKGAERGLQALDSHAMAVRLAALAGEAKEKELSMAKIIERAIEETGMTNPQAAMEEVNKHLQKEIDEVLNEIKNNKELMEEAEAWEALGDLLESNLTKEQAEAFIELVQGHIRGMK